MKMETRFIVIDDDLINNMLCKIVIKETSGESEIKTFNNPETGFEYIANEYGDTKSKVPTVLLLDINMPSWTGWDFLNNFEKLDQKIKDQIKIYMLSSSVDSKDIERALTNKNVVNYIMKPLSMKKVSDILLSGN